MLSHLGLIVLPAIQGMSAIWDVHYCEDSLYKVIKKERILENMKTEPCDRAEIYVCRFAILSQTCRSKSW